MIVILKRGEDILCLWTFLNEPLFLWLLTRITEEGNEIFIKKVFFNSVRLTPSLPHLFDWNNNKSYKIYIRSKFKSFYGPFGESETVRRDIKDKKQKMKMKHHKYKIICAYITQHIWSIQAKFKEGAHSHINAHKDNSYL